MLHGRNKRFLFPWEKKFFHMQNIFIVPAMQYGCRAKPLYSKLTGQRIFPTNAVKGRPKLLSNFFAVLLEK